MKSLEFLRQKGLIEKDHAELTIATENAGMHELNELLNEFSSMKVEEAKEEIRQWLMDEDFEGLSERI